jgi:hypothetical protein
VIARRRIGRAEIIVVAIVSLLFGAAPTAGDVGGCGRTATDLDEARFRSARRQVDCKRCGACGLGSKRCARACDRAEPPEIGFPPTCHPLLHDGEVCLNALLAASCSDYAAYMDDVAPATPTECDFCRVPFDDEAGLE